MIYIIGGPTGTGKTLLATTLAKAWHAPLINADAFQMYQGMDIGTNKDLESLKGIEHYLFDAISPAESMTVARYQRDARQLFDLLLKKHPRIIVVGGTGLYIKASLFDFSFAQHETNPDLSKFEALSNEKLHDYLRSVDPTSSQRIHANNRRRVLRAIAILHATGKTKTEQEQEQKKTILYPATWIGMNPNRDILYTRIDERVNSMFQQGLIDEVQTLIKKFGSQLQAFQAIGYKEVIHHLHGDIDLSSTIHLIQQSSRRYAKRQLTYFRHQFPMTWYNDWQTAAKEILR
jgi:tRNA dimethylallyltransferase